MFERHGLVNLDVSSGAHNQTQYTNLFDWLRLDMEAVHPWNKDHTGAPAKGCPKLFFFADIAHDIANEYETIPAEPDDRKKLRRNSVGIIDERYPHDATDCQKYFTSDEPCWMGDEKTGSGDDDDYHEAPVRKGSPFTGW